MVSPLGDPQRVYTVEHVAGVAPDGHSRVLVVTRRRQVASGGRAAEAGGTLGGEGALTSWVTRRRVHREHVAAAARITDAGLLLVRQPWQVAVVDAKAESVRRVRRWVSPAVTRSGIPVEHVRRRRADGHLTVFWWSPAAAGGKRWTPDPDRA